MAELQHLIKNIEQWAEDRNLIGGSTPQKQFIKLMEEFGELCAGIARNDKEKIKDSIGDCFVVMVILAKQNHIDSVLETISNLDSFQPVFELDVEEIIAETVVSLGMLASELMGQNLEMPTKIDAIFGCPCLSLKLISRKYNLMLTDCVQAAWDEIKDRKGRMIDGVFVKEGDL
ncbi:MazG-like family protein [Haemophilus haemolyticus]|uniref:MazG-like family protein n=1 Tax=Haemophilus haemolyticus TaxID=726 RepID=UPI000E0D946F|nr:MazG-like family protein [Haemophilus haemolyticus]